MESTNFWHLSTGIPAQDDLTALHNSSAFLDFASEKAFFCHTTCFLLDEGPEIGLATP